MKPTRPAAPDNWDDNLDVTEQIVDSNSKRTTTPVDTLVQPSWRTVEPTCQPIISIDGHTPYQPQVKIISRKAQDSSAEGAKTVDTSKTSQSLEERQQRYQEARSRIFGGPELNKTKEVTNKRHG